MTVQRAAAQQMAPLELKLAEKVGEGLAHVGLGVGEGVLNAARFGWDTFTWINHHGLLPKVSDQAIDRTANNISHGTIEAVKGVSRAAKFADENLGLNKVVTDDVVDRAADGIWTAVSKSVKGVVNTIEAFDKTRIGQAVNRGFERVIG